MTKTIVQKEGTNWAVGIVGDTKREVERRYFYFWNNKATDGELFWLKDEAAPFVAYFWTDKDRLKESLKNASLLEAMQAGFGDDFKGKKGGLMPFAKDIAESKFLEIKTETFIDRTKRYNFYTLGSIKAENFYRVALSALDRTTLHNKNESNGGIFKKIK